MFTVQVFDDLQLVAYDLNVDNLDVHAVRIYTYCNYIHIRIYMYILCKLSHGALCSNIRSVLTTYGSKKH